MIKAVTGLIFIIKSSSGFDRVNMYLIDFSGKEQCLIFFKLVHSKFIAHNFIKVFKFTTWFWQIPLLRYFSSNIRVRIANSGLIFWRKTKKVLSNAEKYSLTFYLKIAIRVDTTVQISYVRTPKNDVLSFSSFCELSIWYKTFS